MRFITIASTVAASASLALAQGVSPSATINNNCGSNVFVWEVADSTGPCTTLTPGATVTKPFVTRQSGGVSIKMARSDDIWVQMPITQFEYTWTPGDSFGGLWYDISNIDGDPFADDHTQIIPNLFSGVANTTNCNTVTCPPGGHCIDAYNVPSDNQVVKTCPDQTNLVFNLCGSGSGNSASSGNSPSYGNSGSSSSSVAAAPSSTPSPVATTPSATPTPTITPSPVHSNAVPSAPVSAAAGPETTIVTMTVQATHTAVAAPGPNAYAPQWSEEDAVVREGAIGKREAHQNHMERHQRIARMHHARSA